MSGREFKGWLAYYELEPFGAERDNWHMARVASILANAYRRPNSPPIKMSEFFYVDAETARKRSDEQTLSWLMQSSIEKN